jgi:hypothetical protein
MDELARGIYDPAASLRGMVAHSETVEPESDVAGDETGDGLWNLKHQQFGVTFNFGDGLPGALYSNFHCLPWRNKFKDATEIRIWYKGIVLVKGEEVEGDWKAIITGKRLDRIHDHLREGRRISVNKTGPVMDGRKCQVEKIEILKYEVGE